HAPKPAVFDHPEWQKLQSSRFGARRIVQRSRTVAPSFNGRTPASGAGYRGSNPWGATRYLSLTRAFTPSFASSTSANYRYGAWRAITYCPRFLLAAEQIMAHPTALF